MPGMNPGSRSRPIEICASRRGALNHRELGLRQKGLSAGQLTRQIFVDDVVEPPLREGLLFCAHSHLEQLLERFAPGSMGLEEGVILKRISRSFDVHVVKRMGGKVVVDDVLWRHPEKSRLRNAEKLRQVGGIPGPDLKSPIDIGNSVGVAVDKRVDGNLAFVRKFSDEASSGSRGNTGERDQDAV